MLTSVKRVLSITGTPDGLLFSGDVVRVVCRTITGDRAILADHMDFCTGIGMGEAHVVFEDESVRKAACIGGMLTMVGDRHRSDSPEVRKPGIIRIASPARQLHTPKPNAFHCFDSVFTAAKSGQAEVSFAHSAKTGAGVLHVGHDDR